MARARRRSRVWWALAALAFMALAKKYDAARTRARLSFAQLRELALRAGFSADVADVAAAIAIAESGGDPNAETLTRREHSIGLWQINVQAHPELAGQALTEPAINATAALMVYRAAGDSFGPWTTYTSGAYLQHLPTNEG